eukprot:TRINITY_DN7098_c0_g1_i12.p1 TRINITY_DN7098_c0_g1~~TRINITY_DN7098_c0_g1_i12.p1  ORF type:complete len:131 (+),score=20.23 TRINITY_DN7098_c0_g1_i12:534-926(+)
MSGVVVHFFPGIPGAVHDLTCIAGSSKYWAVLADKGYQGLQNFIPVYSPKKNLKHQRLTTEDETRNAKLAATRIRCENWYGRLKNWRCLAAKFRGDREETYKKYFAICAALTNFHCALQPKSFSPILTKN